MKHNGRISQPHFTCILLLVCIFTQFCGCNKDKNKETAQTLPGNSAVKQPAVTAENKDDTSANNDDKSGNGNMAIERPYISDAGTDQSDTTTSESNIPSDPVAFPETSSDQGLPAQPSDSVSVADSGAKPDENNDAANNTDENAGGGTASNEPVGTTQDNPTSVSETAASSNSMEIDTSVFQDIPKHENKYAVEPTEQDASKPSDQDASKPDNLADTNPEEQTDRKPDIDTPAKVALPNLRPDGTKPSTSSGNGSNDVNTNELPGVESVPESEIVTAPIVDVAATELMQKVVHAYKTATSYGDKGEIVLEFEDAEPFTMPCSIAYQSPNLFRMEVAFGQLVCTGKSIFAQVHSFFGQLLKQPAPVKLTIPAIYCDQYFAEAVDLQIPANFFWIPPQMILLFANDPLKTLVPENADVALLEPGRIGSIQCDRISVAAPDGARIYWVEKDTFALQRIELPVDGINPLNGKKPSALRVDLHDAVIDPKLSDEAFSMATPDSAIVLEHFVPWQLLIAGKKLENFDKIKIRSLKDEEFALSRYADQVVILQFWSKDNEASQHALEQINKVFQENRDNKKLRFFAVNVDEQEVSNEEIAKEIRQLTDDLDNWTPLPTCRLPSNELLVSLRLEYFPTLVILAPGGEVAYYFPPDVISAQELTAALSNVLAGKNDIKELLEEFKTAQNKFADKIRESVDADLYAEKYVSKSADDNAGAVTDANLEEVSNNSSLEILPQQLPEKLKLEEKFVISSLDTPGNILVVPPQKAGEQPLFLVLCGQNSLALFNSLGDVLKRIKPKDALSDDIITFVRTGVTSSGKRIYAASAPFSGRRVFFLDENFNSLGSFPNNEDNTISDVKIADIDSDNEPEIIIATLGG
ncbi:MAG: thioredoxin-like domain-containing protein, partial [Thermoguttaceae bacterium]